MARFTRTVPAPDVTGSYRAFRPYVRSDFRECCAFCLLHESWSAGERNYELDHFHPVSRFPHLERDFYNLYYACHPCNSTKSDQWPNPALHGEGAAFVDYCRDDFEQHFSLRRDGVLEPLTEAAVYTLETLRLNVPHLVRIRACLVYGNLSLGHPLDIEILLRSQDEPI